MLHNTTDKAAFHIGIGRMPTKLKNDMSSDSRKTLRGGLAFVQAFQTTKSQIPLSYFSTFVFICLHEGISGRELADRLELPSTTVSKYLAALGEGNKEFGPGLGLIEYETDPDEKRRKLATLTFKGREVRDALLFALNHGRQKPLEPESD